MLCGPVCIAASDRAKTSPGCIARPLDAFCGFKQPNAGGRRLQCVVRQGVSPGLGAAVHTHAPSIEAFRTSTTPTLRGEACLLLPATGDRAVPDDGQSPTVPPPPICASVRPT